jgi:hypothetical protein
VDTLAGLLDGPRARDAFLLRSLLSPPWAMRIEDRAPLTLVAVAAGTAFLTVDDAEPRADNRSVRLDTGDVAVLRGPEPYTVADDPGTRIQVVIRPSQSCHTVDHDARPMVGLGVRTWATTPPTPSATTHPVAPRCSPAPTSYPARPAADCSTRCRRWCWSAQATGRATGTTR